MWRVRRQVTTILTFILAIFLVVVFPYWATHRQAPSCFDNKQNQSESGIDCGGPCTILCKGSVEVKDIKVVWVNMYPVRSGAYDVVAYVENTNFAIGAPRIPYIAKLIDANGQVIVTRRGETFANPNERFAIFIGNMLTGEKVPVRGSVEIPSDFAWVTTSAPKKSLSVSDKVLVGTDSLPKLSALLSSGESEVLRNIDVTAVLYDSKGKPIAVSGTTVEKLAPKGSEKLFFTWPAPLSYVAETEQCETPVDIVLALDRSGSMNSDGATPPQPLTEAKQAASRFVDRLTQEDQAAYVSFATAASNPIDQILTNDRARLKRAIDRTTIGTDGLQYTNIADALRLAIDEFGTFRRNTNARSVIVLLTDGIPNRPQNPSNLEDKNYASVAARKLADEAKSKDINIYTIGLGDEVNGDFLTELSSAPEYYYKAASGADLGEIYHQIGAAICKKGPSVIEIIPRINITALPTAQ